MDKNKCPKLKTKKKFCEKKVFSYRNKPKTFLTKMRAFSRKITFLHILALLQKKRPTMSKKNPNFAFCKTFFGFFFAPKKTTPSKLRSFEKCLGFFRLCKNFAD